MLDGHALCAIRKRLKIPQEQMARLLGVSFASVNRWEMGHSTPTGPTRDIYVAIETALRAGHAPQEIIQASNGERGAFLYTLFRMAYQKSGRVR